jgi:hypothetical protein
LLSTKHQNSTRRKFIQSSDEDGSNASNTNASANNSAAEDVEYQFEMMRCLRDVNIDSNTVGWYQSTFLGSYLTQA